MSTPEDQPRSSTGHTVDDEAQMILSLNASVQRDENGCTVLVIPGGHAVQLAILLGAGLTCEELLDSLRQDLANSRQKDSDTEDQAVGANPALEVHSVGTQQTAALEQGVIDFNSMTSPELFRLYNQIFAAMNTRIMTEINDDASDKVAG